MDIQLFNDPNLVPQPKHKIKIEALNATPYPDRFRIFIEIKVTPFQERPNLILVARNTEGRIVGELNIIETMHYDMEFTLHIRGVDDPAGDYTLTADLFYETKNPPQDRKTVDFTVPMQEETSEE
jgi:hypothetical protein